MCVRVCSAFKILKHFADIQELLWQVCSWKKKNTSAPCVSFPTVTYNNMADMRTCEAATTPAPVVLEYWTYVRQHILKIWADLLNAKNKCGGRAIILCSYWRNSLRHCSTSRKVAGSIPDGVICIFWHNSSTGVDSASNRNEYQEYFLWGKDGRCVGLTTYVHRPIV